MHQCVHGQLMLKLSLLISGRQLTIEQQVHDLRIAGLRRQVLYTIATVAEYTLLAIEEGDSRLACAGILITLIVRDEARLSTQLRYVDCTFIFCPCYDRKLY